MSQNFASLIWQLHSKFLNCYCEFVTKDKSVPYFPQKLDLSPKSVPYNLSLISGNFVYLVEGSLQMWSLLALPFASFTHLLFARAHLSSQSLVAFL